MRLFIRHQTRYVFDTPIQYALQQLRKTPRSNARQTIVHWKTSVEGGREQLSYEDHHHNIVELIAFDRGCEEMIVTSEGEVEVLDDSGMAGFHFGRTPLWYFKRETPLTTVGSGVRALARRASSESTLDTLHQLSRIILERIRYDKTVGETHMDAETAIAQGAGVCQDHAHVFIACARELGIPARYVSGYLRLDGQDEQQAMHAWAEAHVADLGWVGFDVSNQICPDSRYVSVATGADYVEAAPVRGSQVGGEGENLSVDITVCQQ